MMLGYVHNTTKIWRIWNFNSGKAGRAVECSSVVFDENEDAFSSSTGEQVKTVEFPDQTVDQSQEVDEMTVERTDNSLGMQDTGKSPFVTAYFAGGEMSSCLKNGRGSR